MAQLRNGQKKLNFYVSSELWDYIEDEASKMSLTKTSFLITVLNEHRREELRLQHRLDSNDDLASLMWDMDILERKMNEITK